MNINFKLSKLETNKTKKENINFPKFATTENQQKYQTKIEENSENYKKEKNSQMKWNKIVKTCIDSAKEVLGKREQKIKHKDPKLEILSQQNKKLKEDIQAAKSQKSRTEKKEERKRIKIKIKKIIKTHQEEELEIELQEIESLKDDSNRYYQATKKLKNKNKTNTLYVQDPKENFASTNTQKIEIISTFFKDMLAPPIDETHLKKYQPTPMKIPFNTLEIKKNSKISKKW